jgi:hypothetical protein
MIEAAIRDQLVSDLVVAALVVDRVSPAPLPEGSEMPAVTYQRISRLTPITHDGLRGPSRARVQVDSWAEVYTETKVLAKAVEDALLRMRGLVAGHHVQGVFFDSDQDLYEPDVKLHRVRADYFVWCDDN